MKKRPKFLYSLDVLVGTRSQIGAIFFSSMLQNHFSAADHDQLIALHKL